MRFCCAARCDISVIAQVVRRILHPAGSKADHRDAGRLGGSARADGRRGPWWRAGACPDLRHDRARPYCLNRPGRGDCWPAAAARRHAAAGVAGRSRSGQGDRHARTPPHVASFRALGIINLVVPAGYKPRSDDARGWHRAGHARSIARGTSAIGSLTPTCSRSSRLLTRALRRCHRWRGERVAIGPALAHRSLARPP